MSRLIAALAAALWLAPALLAADAPAPAPARPPRIGYVDIVRVQAEYKLARKYEAETTEWRQTMLMKNQTTLDELERLKSSIEKLPMGSPERLDLQKRHQDLYRESNEMLQAAIRSMDATQSDRLRQVYADLTATVSAVAKEGDYDLVLQEQNRAVDGKHRAEVISQVTGRVVLYAKDGYDLTDTVIKRLNAAYDEKTKADAAKATATPAPQTDEKRTK